MYFGLPEEARALSGALRDLLSSACTPDVIRRSWPPDNPAALDELWGQLAAVGLLGLLVPEPRGLGLDDLVAVAALQEAGVAGVPGPLVETAYVAAPLLAAAGQLPDAVLAGRERVAVQRRELVPHAQDCAYVLQLTRRSAQLLDVQDAVVTPVATVDASRRAARVTGNGRPLQVDPAQVELAGRRGTLGTAAVLIGLSRRMLDLTVTYVQQREQFGVPVGSFQAVKHPLANALLAVEFAGPAVLRAAQSLTEDDPEAALHVSMAKSLASDAARQVTGAALQAHGAMGYTVDYDLHLFAKRAWALAADWGSAAEHRAIIARAVLPDERNTG